MRSSPDLKSHAKLAERARQHSTRKIGPRTIGHLLNAEGGPQPQLDTIVAVAAAFKVDPAMLLCPEFDPAAPLPQRQFDARVLELARTIAVLPDERRELLMEIFAREGVPDPKDEVKMLHDAAARRYETARPRKK